MTDTEFLATLERLGWKQADAKAVLEHLSGEVIGNNTINRYATGKRAIPPTLAALLQVLEHEVSEKRREKLLAEARTRAQGRRPGVSNTPAPATKAPPAP